MRSWVRGSFVPLCKRDGMKAFCLSFVNPFIGKTEVAGQATLAVARDGWRCWCIFDSTPA